MTAREARQGRRVRCGTLTGEVTGVGLRGTVVVSWSDGSRTPHLPSSLSADDDVEGAPTLPAPAQEPDIEVELVRVAFEAGRRAEREDVLEWLRSDPWGRDLLDMLADQIERGSHTRRGP